MMGGGDASQQSGDAGEKKLGRVDKTLLGAARWAQRRSPRSSSQLPVTEPEEATGSKWGGLAGAFEQYAVAMSGVPGASDAISLLSALYGVEDAQAAMLGTIDRNVRLLREGPFQTGRLLLQEAARVGAGDPDFQHFLSTARDHLYDAHGLAASVQERSLVEFYLGSVYALDNRPADAAHWLQQSYESARSVVVGLSAQADNVKVLHNKTTTAALTYLYPAGALVVPAKLKKVWTAEHAATALEAFLPFVNCVARSLNSVSKEQHLQPMELSDAGDGTYALNVGEPPDPSPSTDGPNPSTP